MGDEVPAADALAIDADALTTVANRLPTPGYDRRRVTPGVVQRSEPEAFLETGHDLFDGLVDDRSVTALPRSAVLPHERGARATPEALVATTHSDRRS
jgi:hypothetical protein